MSSAKSKAKGAAPGQYLGYALQPTRLFFHLLDCPPNAAVGLEFVDDVSIHVNGKTTYAEQCKSALSQNPISNWHVDLWKTFVNWLENIEKGHIDPTTCQFRLYVTPAKTGPFAAKFSDIQDEDEIKKLIGEIEKARSALLKPPTCNANVQKFLDADFTVICAIVRNFKLISSDPDPLEPIRNHLASTVRHELIDTACQYGIGEAKREIDEKIRNNQPPLIIASEFRKRFIAFIRAHDSERVLHSLSEAPTDEIIQSTLSQAPTFVKQLALINADVETKSRAAGDFLRTSGDRTFWADEGIVFRESFKTYDEQLIRRNKNLGTEVQIAHSTVSPEDRGRLLYAKCCEAPPIDLEQRVVPGHFMPGSLNALADRAEIGWHPDFIKLLEENADQ
ncbi:MAG: ABC-three component system protein [Hyphomonas sp.]|uniref:ABC-three component system protein n=1 Tax=Hyphomonas sp. TaxID=87 RepID=UPI0030035E8F